VVSLQQGVQNFVDSVECFILSNNPWVNGSARALRPEARAIFNDRINEARRARGCDPIDDVEPPPPPFQGGQCGVPYLVRVRPIVNGTPSNVQGLTLRGPLGGPIQTQSGNTFSFAFTAQGRAGTFAGDCLTPNFTPGTEVVSSINTDPSNEVTFEIVELRRCDNLPDTCGDPPIVYPPPTNINIDGDVTYNIEGDTEVTVNIPFVFAPIEVNFDGTLNVPFSFELGGINFSGNFDIAPELNVTINPPRLDPGEGQDTDTLPPGDEEEEVQPRQFDQKIIGVAVVSSLVGEQQLTTIATQNIPNIFAPRAGSIKFAYSIGAATFWSNDIDIKGARVFIPCPFQRGADAVSVSPAPGVAVQWREIVGPPIATVADL
jgi:hypothetical protein